MKHVKFVEDCEEVFRISVDAMQPGRFLVDLIPACEVLAYADERTLTVSPVKHIPSWIPGSPRGYAEPLKKRLMTVFGAPFDYAQSRIVRFPSDFESMRPKLFLGFWTELSINYSSSSKGRKRAHRPRTTKTPNGWLASFSSVSSTLLICALVTDLDRQLESKPYAVNVRCSILATNLTLRHMPLS
jgi:hypothetical protein